MLLLDMVAPFFTLLFSGLDYGYICVELRRVVYCFDTRLMLFHQKSPVFPEFYQDRSQGVPA